MSAADGGGVGPPVDGPAVGRHVAAAIVVTLVVLVPLVVIGVSLGIVLQDDWKDRGTAAAVVLAIGGGILLFVLLILVNVVTTSRDARREHLLVLTNRVGPRAHHRPRLSWYGCWDGEAGRHWGALYVVGDEVSFWALKSTFGGMEPGKDALAKGDRRSVRAVEVERTGPFERIRTGSSRAVVVFFEDGRRLRLAAVDADGLAEQLRGVVGRPDGAPVGPPSDEALLDRVTVEQIGRALARRARLVALVVKERDDPAERPHVVLEGPAEELRGAIELARDVLVRESTDPEAPYESARRADVAEG